MERITEKMLSNKVEQLNKIAGFENAEYSTVGVYTLDFAYGGVDLHQYVNEHGGIREIFYVGHVTKRELYNLINAYISGQADVMGRKHIDLLGF